MDWINSYLRQHKDRVGKKQYSTFRMDESFNITKENIASIVARAPQSAMIFNQWNTACVGCHLARFCTLEDVAVSYQLNKDVLILEIYQSLIPTTKNPINKEN